MKTYFLAVLFILFYTAANAQEKFSNIQSKVTDVMNTYKKEDPNYLFVNNILTNFLSSPKINSSDLTKNNIGIGIILSQDYPQLKVFPAKIIYNDNNLLVTTFCTATGDVSPEGKEYTEKYLYEFESLSFTKYYRWLISADFPTSGSITQNNSEFVITDDNRLSFIRGNKDWIFVISIDKDYKKLEVPIVIVQAFRTSLLSKNIFNTNNSPSDIEKRIATNKQNEIISKNDFPLYHDKRIDDIRKLSKDLLIDDSFKNNETLKKYIAKIDKPLTRYNIQDYTKELIYFSDLNLDKFKVNKNNIIPDERFLIKHLSAHSLGDYYLSQKKYNDAISYFKKSIIESPYQVTSGTTYSKDAGRIMYDIANCYYKSGYKNEAYAYLIAILLSESDLEKVASTNLIDYLHQDGENLTVFKQDIDQALKTITRTQDNDYMTFNFRNKETIFIPIYVTKNSYYENKMYETVFYKML